MERDLVWPYLEDEVCVALSSVVSSIWVVLLWMGLQVYQVFFDLLIYIMIVICGTSSLSSFLRFLRLLHECNLWNYKFFKFLRSRWTYEVIKAIINLIWCLLLLLV